MVRRRLRQYQSEKAALLMRAPAIQPVADAATISGDGWTFKAAPGWVIREGARRGDYEVVRQQP